MSDLHPDRPIWIEEPPGTDEARQKRKGNSSAAKPRLTLLYGEEAAQPPADEGTTIVRGVLHKGSITLISGQPKSGKSFLATNLFIAVADEDRTLRGFHDLHDARPGLRRAGHEPRAQAVAAELCRVQGRLRRARLHDQRHVRPTNAPGAHLTASVHRPQQHPLGDRCGL
jgi:hypothetical protein